MRGTTKNLREGTRIAVTRKGSPIRGDRTTTGTVVYLARDYDGRSRRWSVIFTDDKTGQEDLAWLNEVRVLR